MEMIFKAIVLGIVEGVTEFLPVSSTGHLILTGYIIGFSGPFSVIFYIIIQLGAILAVVVYYKEKIIKSLHNVKPGEWGYKLWVQIIIAFIPSAFFGLIFNDIIEKYLFSALTVSLALIVGAILILIVEKQVSSARKDDILSISPRESLLIGLAQCMSLFPGMSRSASTMIGGMLLGLSTKAAAEFSFFLAIPTMFAATGYSLLKGVSTMTSIEWISLAVGFIVSFLVAYIVVGKFITYIGNHSLKIFAYYRLIVGVIMLFVISN
jgi:undecaprenyl-diphosphatase